MLEPIHVRSESHSYPVWVGCGVLPQQYWLDNLPPLEQILIVTLPECETLADSLMTRFATHLGGTVNKMVLPVQEQDKGLETAQQIWFELIRLEYGRQAVLVAVGGGMLGDLIGFCAGCYMRGIRFIQVPTTLLAQVDASVGGKTAVNFAGYKNMLGLFYPPIAVIADIHALKSLSDYDFVSAIPELIKYGLAFDATFFAWLESNITGLVARDEQILQRAVSWSIKIKAKVVEQDEKESGYRMLLNLGHTLGHALERCQTQPPIPHGQAVGLGLLFSLQLSEKHCGLSPAVRQRVTAMLQLSNNPVSMPAGISSAAILATIGMDKKHLPDKYRWILVESLGKACVVTLEKDVIGYYLKGWDQHAQVEYFEG